MADSYIKTYGGKQTVAPKLYQDSRPGPVSVMKARPKDEPSRARPGVTESPRLPRQALAPESFSIREAEALVGSRLKVLKPPHALVPQGALGIVDTYKMLAAEIVLKLKWDDGSHDYYTKSEYSRSLCAA